MGLLDLPTELRLHIYTFVSDLQPGRQETIAVNYRPTPAISRINQALRAETLPIYARNSEFVIHIDDDLDLPSSRVNVWLQTLGERYLHEVQNLQLSRHWSMQRPTRWQGHVGFYVRLHVQAEQWQCSTGTYPVANDRRGMRVNSVRLLQEIVAKKVSLVHATKQKGLVKADITFVLEAMEVVASHPVTGYGIEQGEDSGQRRREIWDDMEGQLLALSVNGEDK